MGNNRTPKGQSVERLAFTTTETAAALGVSRTTVWRLVQRGFLKPCRGLRHPRFSRPEIDRFLAETA